MKRFVLFFAALLQISNTRLCTAQSIVWQRVLGPDREYVIYSMACSNSGIVFASTGGGRIYRSDDNGTTWTKAGISLAHRNFSFYPIIVLKNEHILAGSPSGLYRSTDLGLTWQSLNNIAWSLATDSTGRIYRSGTDSDVMWSDDDGNTWQGRVLLDPATLGPITMIEVLYNQNIFARSDFGKAYSSVDRGLTWQPITKIEFLPRVSAISKPINGRTFFANGRNVYRAGGGDSSWTLVNTFPKQVTSFGSNSLGHIFALCDEGVYQSTNDGLSWTNQSTGLDTIGLFTMTVSPYGIGFVGTTIYPNAVTFGSIFRTTGSTTGIVSGGARFNREFFLYNNYPNPFNPFNPSTNIQFSLPHSGFVTLKVYNTLGEEVATLASENFPAGIHKVEWNASDIASGVYLYRLQVGSNLVQAKKLVVIK